MHNRRFFIAGEDPVLLGGSVPYVLRPDGDNWEFVSECYVDGIMFGEAMEWTKEDGFEYEVFTLI